MKSYRHLWALAFCILTTGRVAVASVVLTVAPDSKVSVRASPDGNPDCAQEKQISGSGGSASCATFGVSAQSAISIQVNTANNLTTVVIDANVRGQVPPIGDEAHAALQFTAMLAVTDRAVQYHIDFNPSFGGGQTGDSSGSVILAGHGEFGVGAGGSVTDTLQRDGTLDIGDHTLIFRVQIQADNDESVFANGVMTMTLQPATEFQWNTVGGGDYSVADNWKPKGVPIHDAQFSDTAVFDLLGAPRPVVVTTANATAGRWLIRNMHVYTEGATQVLGATAAEPSLAIGDGGVLSLGGAAHFQSVHASLGDSGEGRMVLADTANWISSGTAAIGDAGLAWVLVQDQATVDAQQILVGRTAKGQLFASGGAVKAQEIDIAGLAFPDAAVEINNGGQVEAQEVTIAGAPGVSALVKVLGIDGAKPSTLKAAGALLLGSVSNDPSNQAALIANDGSLVDVGDLTIAGGPGTRLEVTNGSQLKTASYCLIGAGFGNGKILVNNTASGLSRLTGASWASGGGVGIGGPNEAELVVEDAGVVLVGSSARVTVGEGFGLKGRMTVADNGWVTGGELVVGSGGDGTLEISGGGEVDSQTASVGGTTGTGFATINSLVSPSTWRVASDLRVGGQGAAGTIKLDSLPLIGNARVEVGGTLTVGALGTIFGNGKLAVPPSRRVVNGGFIQIGLSPGQITIEGDYEQQEVGVLVIEVAGLEPGQFDVLEVTGNATLAGKVQIKFIDGYVANTGDTIDFLQVGGTTTGQLAIETLDADGQPAPVNATARMTPEGVLRLTIGDISAGVPAITACGGGTCGAGVTTMLPLSLVAMGRWRWRLRRRESDGRSGQDLKARETLIQRSN